LKKKRRGIPKGEAGLRGEKRKAYYHRLTRGPSVTARASGTRAGKEDTLEKAFLA